MFVRIQMAWEIIIQEWQGLYLMLNDAESLREQILDPVLTVVKLVYMLPFY